MSHPVAASRTARLLERIPRFLAFQARLWRFCARRLHETNLSAMAAALSFKTIFALVPTLVLAAVVAGSLGFLEDTKQSLRAFLDASGLSRLVAVEDAGTTAPVAGAEPGAATAPAGRRVINVAAELEELVATVEHKLRFERIGPIGAVLLIWTAVGLLSTMEASLNRVFNAARNRSLPRRVLLYWSVLSLAPILLAVAVYAGRQVLALGEGVPQLTGLLAVAGRLAPIVVGIALLAAVYALLPNTRVPYRACLGGAVVAVPLWLLAKWAFGLYVARFVVDGNLYGILGAVPLFLMWLNLSWHIFLFGAQLAHAAASLGQLHLPDEDEPAVVTSLHAAELVVAVGRSFVAGRGPVSTAELATRLQVAPAGMRWLVDRLAARGVLAVANGGANERCVLARPPDRLMLADVFDALEPGAEQSGPNGADRSAPAGHHALRERLRAGVAGVHLADLLSPRA